MIRLILVRHGNTFGKLEQPVQIGKKTDLPLVPEGRIQAEQIASYLQKVRIAPDSIYAGPLKRQIESAEIIAKPFGLEVLQTPCLDELDYGVWENLSSEEISFRWPNEFSQWNSEAQWPDRIFGGSRKEHLEKINSWFAQLEKEAPSSLFPSESEIRRTVIGVTSNGILRLFQKEKVKTGHFSEAILSKGKIEILSWNRTPLEPGPSPLRLSPL